MIATSGFVTALEHTKVVFGRGSAPDPTGGAYSAPPDPLAGLRGSTCKGERREGDERYWRRLPTFRKLLDPPLIVVYGAM